jgi:hypothetical protein
MQNLSMILINFVFSKLIDLPNENHCFLELNKEKN